MNNVSNIKKELEEVIGERWVITDIDLIQNYLKDETPDPVRPTANGNFILVKPISTLEVSQILRLANRNKISVFPVGGRTGLVGGSIPTEDGLILSVERMKKIEIDKENLMTIADAGVTLGELIDSAEKAHLFFPPHPGDEGAQVGGLVATNAGGVRAVKYGVMRNYVKGIEVVLPTGEILNLGGILLKNNTGYDIMQMIIGSEGTLCVITKAIMKLYPKTPNMVTIVAPFEKRNDAINGVIEILQSEILPLAIEYVQKKEIVEAAQHINEEWPVKQGFAQLIVILTATSEEELFSACVRISEICERNNAGEVILAETKEEQDRILRVRSNIYTTLKSRMIDILDVTVPPSNLGKLMDKVDEIAEENGVNLPIYGHAGDGNLHIHIMREDDRDSSYIKPMKNKIYQAGISLGGVITGEHGIGKIRTDEIKLVLDEKTIELLRGIKKLFDPNNILNPGKVLPSS